MSVKLKNPAAFAENYLINNIWNNCFPAGSLLPAERDLAERIGVTRTTLREVLQRLARDGWLTIQHGKPTRVNNIWDTAGLNILETLARLDNEQVPRLIDNLLAVRTSIASIYIDKAIRKYPENALQAINNALKNPELSPAQRDYHIFRGLAFSSGNPIYGLILNGMQGLYLNLAEQYFADKAACELAHNFYQLLLHHCITGTTSEQINEIVRNYGRLSGEIWQSLPNKFKADMLATNANFSAEKTK